MTTRNLSVRLEGLDILLEELSTKRISKQLAQGVDHATSSLKESIRLSVLSYYNTSSEEIDSVLLRKSSSSATRGRNIIKSGLEYKFKPKPLSSFPLRESTVSVESRFMIPRKSAGNNLIKKTTAKAVSVSVRKGRFKTVAGKHGFGGFLQKRGTSKWAAIQGGRVSSFPKGIYERKQDATWKVEPFDRAPITRLFGPSVTDMIDNRLRFDPLLKNTVDNFDLLLGKFVTL